MKNQKKQKKKISQITLRFFVKISKIILTKTQEKFKLMTHCLGDNLITDFFDKPLHNTNESMLCKENFFLLKFNLDNATKNIQKSYNQAHKVTNFLIFESSIRID